MNNVFLKSINIIKETLEESGFLRGGEFKGYNGHYFCDCSSLINSILKIENLSLFESINPGGSSFKSADYFNYAVRKNSFLDNISELRPGDLLCWKKKFIPKSGDTGHMAIVVTTPVELEKNMYEVKVFDATKIPHAEDTRSDHGVGEGTLYLEADHSKRIIGVRWSNKIKKVKRTPIIAIRF